MARNTIQIWQKIWNSSLHDSDWLRTKRLKTCSRPTTHIAAKIAATRYSTPRSIPANNFFISLPFSFLPWGLADLLEQLLSAELLRQVILRLHRGLDQRRGVDLVHLHAELPHLGQRLAFALRRHLAHQLRRVVRGL